MDVDQQPVVFHLLVEPYAVIDVFLQPHHFHVFLLYFAPPPFPVPLPDLQTTSVHINILDFEIDMLYLCFWQSQPEKMKIVLIPPRSRRAVFLFHASDPKCTEC